MQTGTRRPGRVRLARTLAWPALLLPAIMLVLHLANTDTPVQTWWGGFVIIAAGLGAMGALLAIRLPDNPIGWIFLIGSLGQGIAGVGREWAVFGFVTHPGTVPLAEWGAWVSWASTISLASFPMALLRLPDGRLPGRFERVVQIVIIAATALSVLTSAVEPGEYTDQMPGLANPLGLDWAPLVVGEIISWMALSLTTLLGVASLVRRWWRGSRELRVSLRWVVAGAGLLAVEMVLENSPLATSPVFVWLGPAAFLVFITTVTICVLRYRLWDVDVLIDISLVYGIVTVLIGGTFVALVGVTSRTLDQHDVFWPSLIAVAVFALAFVPLRNQVRDWISRLRHGTGADPYLALEMLSRRGSSSESAAMLREAVNLVVAQSPLLDYVAVTPLGRATVSAGAARSGIVAAPLAHAGAIVGSVEVSYRPGTVADRASDARFAMLCERLGAVVHAGQIQSAVSESRRAVAVAREEERRRLRRDLHDGLGPALAAIALQVDGAQELMHRDPERAHAVLGSVSSEVRSTIDDIRRLVYDLQPPILDAVGLLAAIAEQAAAFSGPAGGPHRLDVELDVPPQLPDVPAAVEIAAYRIACESLANVARHAEATRCRIRIEIVDDEICMTIDDNGNGRGGSERPGVGTASMIERATELGGSCLISASPLGGTRVAVTLPLADPSASRPPVDGARPDESGRGQSQRDQAEPTAGVLI